MAALAPGWHGAGPAFQVTPPSDVATTLENTVARRIAHPSMAVPKLGSETPALGRIDHVVPPSPLCCNRVPTCAHASTPPGTTVTEGASAAWNVVGVLQV